MRPWEARARVGERAGVVGPSSLQGKRPEQGREASVELRLPVPESRLPKGARAVACCGTRKLERKLVCAFASKRNLHVVAAFHINRAF